MMDTIRPMPVISTVRVVNKLFDGWHRASAAYSDFIRRHENLHVLYLELGVGANTAA